MLSLNPKETEAVIFTRKRNTAEVLRLEYEGVRLTLAKEVEYLGVILEEKLIRETCGASDKERDEDQSGHAFIGKIWVLIPRMVLGLHKHVVIPKTTYSVSHKF